MYIHGRALPQVQASSKVADSQSQGAILAEVAVIKNSLAKFKEEAVFNIEARLAIYSC